MSGSQGIPVGRSDRPAIAWYGDMDFVAHFRRIIARGAVDVVVRFGEPIPFGPQTDRKRVAEQCYEAVAADDRGHPDRPVTEPPSGPSILTSGERG